MHFKMLIGLYLFGSGLFPFFIYCNALEVGVARRYNRSAAAGPRSSATAAAGHRGEYVCAAAAAAAA